MVQISELEVRQNNVDVEGTIIEIGEVKTFNKFGRELRVADAVLKDDSGTIKLSLWNEDINKFKAGDKVKIANGYINEFQGEKQLTAGKFGKIEKIGEGEVSEEEEQAELPGEEPEETEEEPTEEAEDKEESVEEPEAEDKEEQEEEPEEEPEEETEDKEQEDF